MACEFSCFDLELTLQNLRYSMLGMTHKISKLYAIKSDFYKDLLSRTLKSNLYIFSKIF